MNSTKVAAAIAAGLARLRRQPIDVRLIDPLYVTAMLVAREEFGSH
jgi:hypothetical protein